MPENIDRKCRNSKRPMTFHRVRPCYIPLFLAWIFTLAIVVANPSMALSQQVVIENSTGYIDVSSQMSYIEDPGNELAIDDVTAVTARWKAVAEKHVNLGYTGSAYWFRIVLVNPGDAAVPRLLEIDFPTLDRVELYKPNSHGGYSVSLTGDRLPFVSREIMDANFLFRLNLPAGPSNLYLRIESAGSLRFKAAVLSEDILVERRGRQMPLIWLLYGMMLLAALFNLFIFALARDRVYLYFSLFAVLMLLFQAAHRGYAFQFLWPQSPWWANTCSPVFLNLMGAFCALFCSSVMDTRATNRIIDRILALFGLILFPLAAALSMVLPVNIIMPASYYCIVAFAICIIGTMMYYFSRGNRFARYFLSGIAFVGVFAIIGSLTALGKLPSATLTEWSTEAGFLGLIFFVSLGLVDRIRELNAALLVSKEDITRKNEALNRKNEDLEATNEELQATMEELEASNEALFQSSRELEEKTRELDNYFNYALDLFCIADTDGYFHRLNREWERVLGYTMEELQGARFLDFVHPDDVSATLNALSSLGAQKEVFSFTNRYRCRNGSYRWIEWRSYPVGKLIYAAARDMTERINTTEELKKSEERFRNLIESSPEPLVLAREERLVYGNRAFCLLVGAAHQDTFIGKRLLDYVVPDTRVEMAAYIAARGRGEPVPAHFESEGLREDDSTFPCEISISTVDLPDGPALLAYVRNITDRKRAEEALRESERKYRQLFKHAPAGIYEVDLTTGRFKNVNSIICEYTGYSEQELLTRSTVDILTEESARRFLDRLENIARGESVPMNPEYRIKNKDGSIRWVQLNVEFMRQEDRITGATVVAHDITERKQAESDRERMQAQLIQAQKMEAVGTLAGGIAHDFNNMLGGIMGSLDLIDLLLQKDEAPRRESLIKYVETAMESSRRAADITKQLLTISRKSELKLAPVDVTLSLKHIMKLCQNSFPKSVELNFRTGDGRMRIMADPVQIEQVILNLCVNASHAMTVMRPEGERQGGILTVEPGEIICDGAICARHPDARPGESYVRIRVSDTGVGMEESIRLQIFDPFFTTKSSQDGIGLGLAMVYNIVKQHGGFIDVYTDPGRGSTFSIYLPSLGEDLPDQHREAAVSIVRGTGKILIIDDEKAILRIARGMLEQCGYTTLTAQGGQEGIMIFREEHSAIDGVLLDLSMPGLTGLEVFEHMKKIDPGVRVLMASGLMEETEVRKALATGVKGFLQKPYSAGELSTKIKEALG
jgi:two-component system, cell cycle sensor histidine kinase and response regulator CckA